MTGTIQSKLGRHDAIFNFLMGIPTEDLRDMLQDPDELDRKLSEHLADYTFGDFVVAFKDVADRRQHKVKGLLRNTQH